MKRQSQQKKRRSPPSGSPKPGSKASGHFLKWIVLVLGILGACIFTMVACQPAPTPSGRLVQVSRVVSGNTLEVLQTDGGTALATQVRLVGIEAPDLRQDPWGTQAKNRLTELTAGKTVLLEMDVQPQDSYGRILAYIWQDGQLLNEQLVQEGMVLAQGRSPNIKYDQQFAYAQDTARLLGLGLWNPESPLRQTPSEFRAQNPS